MFGVCDVAESVATRKDRFLKRYVLSSLRGILYLQLSFFLSSLYYVLPFFSVNKDVCEDGWKRVICGLRCTGKDEAQVKSGQMIEMIKKFSNTPLQSGKVPDSFNSTFQRYSIHGVWCDNIASWPMQPNLDGTDGGGCVLFVCITWPLT